MAFEVADPLEVLEEVDPWEAFAAVDPWEAIVEVGPWKATQEVASSCLPSVVDQDLVAEVPSWEEASLEVPMEEGDPSCRPWVAVLPVAVLLVEVVASSFLP